MTVSVYCFALNRTKFGTRVAAAADEILAGVETRLSQAEVSPEEQSETLAIVRELLDRRLRSLSSLEELHAACWLLESEAEKTPLYTLQNWKARYFRRLELEQFASSGEPAYFADVTVPEPNWLRYVSSTDLAEHVIPSLRRRLDQHTSSEADELEQEYETYAREAYEELLEVFESIREDGLDVILVALED